ncbi:unnamed protein product [Rhodiola kirilowii]
MIFDDAPAAKEKRREERNEGGGQVCSTSFVRFIRLQFIHTPTILVKTLVDLTFQSGFILLPYPDGGNTFQINN